MSGKNSTLDNPFQKASEMIEEKEEGDVLIKCMTEGCDNKVKLGFCDDCNHKHSCFESDHDCKKIRLVGERTLYRTYLTAHSIKKNHGNIKFNIENEVCTITFPCDCSYSSYGIKDEPDDTNFCSQHPSGFLNG